MFSFAVRKRIVLSYIAEMNNALEFLISALFVVENQAFEPIRKSNGSISEVQARAYGVK